MRKKTLSWLLAALMVGSLVISLPITASADGSAAGNAAVFDATSNSYIEVPDSDSLDATNALTVEAWIKPDNGGEWALIMGKQWNSADANPWYSYRLLAASANPSEQGFPRKVAFQIAPEGSGETGVESTTVVQNDVWTHVAGVYDGSSVKIYINGELEGSNPVKGSIRTSDLPLYLGKAPWTNNNNFNGMIDEVRVWNVARTAAQIDYDMRHTLTGDEPGLVGYWNFDEVSGNTAADATDNSNDGTLNNGAAFAASDTLLSLPDETEIIVANTDNHSIDFFHIAADGNAAPSRTIKGSSTNLNRPVDVALYDGKLYVLNHVAHAIEVFDPAATGDTAPVRRIIGGMSYPSGFDFDTTTQEIFVANYSGDITVYNASDSGIVTPKRTIAKYNAMTVAVSGSELFVTTYTEPAVYVYNKTTGNLLRTIQGANTGLSGNLYGVAISDGELFISDAVNNAIHVFNLTDSGDTEPKRTISGSNTLLDMPRELHIADNKLYIANKNNSVLIFGLMASGNVAPVQVLSGTETTFNAIQGVTVAESDTDDPPETPLLIQSTETRLVDFFPKTTQGENGIYLQRAQNGTYSNLDNFGDFTFKTTDTAWNLPIVILGDKAGNKDNEIIQAEPSTAENSAIRVTLNGDYGLVHVTGSAQMTKASGSARFFIYKGEYGYTEPLWQATLSGLNSDSFDLSIPYTEGEQLFFSIDANGPDTDDWAAWNQIRFIAASDSVSPVLTAGAVYRTSATDATVRFVSDSAGTYYYQVTNSSTTPAVDDLSGWTSGDAVSADTITAVSPAGLTAGAKYVHIVAEDAADNLSDVLTVAMPYDLYYFDDFEAYAANAYPAYYFQKYNGAGDAEQKVISVVQADAATGNVFRLKGQGSWASNQRVMLPAGITGTVTLEYDVKLVTHGGGVAFGRNDVTWSGGIARVDTTPAGMFSAGIGDGTVVHTSTTTCEVGPWYHVALELDYVNRTFNYYVDGIKLNDGALNAHTGYTLDYFGLGSSNAGGDEIYYDNVEVYGGALIVADAPAPILQSAATNTDGTKVILTFNKAMAAPTGESAEFAVIVNNNLDPVTATALDPSDAKNIVLTLTTQIVYGDTVTVSYPPGGSIESSDGGVLATFTDQAVTNMVADTTAAFAWVVYSNGTGLPEGPAKLSLPDGQLTSILSDGSIWMSGAEFIGDQLYGVSYSGAYSDLYTINAQTGACTLVANTGALFSGFAYDTVEQIAYASDAYNLYTVNLATGASVAVGAFSAQNTYMVIGIAADNDGNLFGVDIETDALLSINPTTAEATVIGSLGVDLNFAQDIAYDRDNNILYGTLYNSTSGRGELYSINTSTGQASFICNLGAEIDGFAIPYTGIPHTDTTAPVLTAGAVSRTSDTSATVKFTSDEAGEYYYEVVASGDSAPAIDTEDVGIPCDSSEQTISLTELTAGAKDIYIVVKDASGNVSSSNFKISIPAYVPAAHGSIQFESGSWSVPEDYSSHGYVERVGGSDGIVTVDYYTVDDTAVAGTHYAAQSGTLTWADGDSTPKTIPCTIYNDSTYNGYLQFSYVLSSPTGGAVLGSQDTLLMQIRDNDNPPIPSGLTATAGNGKVTLNWNEVKDAYYRVYFSTTSASYNEADSVDVYDETSTVITGLKNGTKYYFVVKAVHDIYLSPGSNEVSATPTSGNGGGSSISPDTGSQITVSTTDDSTSVTGTLTRVNGGTQIDIKNRAFDKLDAADKPVSINARIATVTFDKKAMDAIGTESGDEDVTITARQVSASELSRKERALVGSRPVYDFTVTGGGKTISSFGGGYATVSIPYTLLPGENPQAVVIWYLSDSGTLESVRGCYDAATKTVTFVTPHFSRFVIGYNLVAFSDITSSAWYYDAVTFLAARGVTTGTTAATFSPDDTLTRGQFIVMLLRAYGIESDSTAAHNFSDSGNTYYTGYLAAAKRLGITNGVGNNRFAPEQSITRQEMFTLLYNALRVIGAPPASTAGRTLTDFSDASAIAPWAKDAMTLLVESGTISGSGGKLNPTGITTRGEMAQVLYNLLSK